MHRLKNESQKNANERLLENHVSTQHITYCWELRSTSRTLLVMLEWIEFGCVHKLYPEESDCVPAVHRPKLVTETGLIVRQ